MEVTEVMYSYGLSLLSIILIIFIVYLQIRIKKTNVRQWCMLILLCALISNIAIMFQILNISNHSTWENFAALSYIGEAMLPICMFFAICYYIEGNFEFKRKYLILFYIPVIAILCMFTNKFHGLMFKNYSINFGECEYGYMYYIYIINVYLTYFLGLVMLVKHFYEIKKEKWHQVVFRKCCSLYSLCYKHFSHNWSFKF